MSDLELGIKRAAEKAGNRAKLAKIVGLTRQTVSQWKRIPAEHVLRIEAETGVPRHELRPDLYPLEPAE